MRSLRLKLVITFLIISIAGTLLTTLIVRTSNTRAFNALLLEQEQTVFVDDVLAYYESNGSWQGVAAAIHSQTPPAAPGEPPAPPPPFALADENGRILIHSGQFPPNSIVTPETLATGTPLVINGVQVGVVLTDERTPPPRDPAQEAFEVQTNRALLLGALGATAVALVLAIILARSLTRPLLELASASRQIAQGNLKQEVPVRTKDELGDLAIAFNQMSAELTHATQSRRQMTADIAHDLRTPLTVLSGYLEAMQDGTLAPTPARLQMMQAEVNSLTRLVADLRTLSLAESGQLTLHKEPVEIGNLLAQVQAAFMYQAAQQGVDLQAETDNSTVIQIDQARVRHVLDNLVSNALRYTPADGAINLSAAPLANGVVHITVQDTGSGISETDLPHIFDRFYRGDKARQEGEGESGLGLAIVKSLVVAHEGTIDVQSTLGMGTIFTIMLPV